MADLAQPAPNLNVIAIDGPAGSGKSTIAQALAKRLELPYLDTGAMYRSVTFAVIATGADPEDAVTTASIAREMTLQMPENGDIIVNGLDATLEIRGPEVTRAVSAVAAHPDVRSELVSRQREWAHRRGGGVLEGRDIGSAVFPDALTKIYLTASAEVRAARRAGEVMDLDYDTVAADIARRDALDTSRQHDPLRRADGAIEVDTTYLDIDEVVSVISAHVDRAIAARAD